MTALITKLKLQHSLSTSAWPNYGLDVLNITMHTEVVIHSMNAYVWCWSKICGSLFFVLIVFISAYYKCTYHLIQSRLEQAINDFI